MSAKRTSDSPVTKPETRMTTLLASARRLTSKVKDSAKSKGGATGQAWQMDAWGTFDIVGEAHFLATTLSNRAGQARMFISKTDLESANEEPAEVEDDQLTALLRLLGNGAQGLSQIIRRLTVNLYVGGEVWLIGIPEKMIPGFTSEDANPEGLSGPEFSYNTREGGIATFAPQVTTEEEVEDPEQAKSTTTKLNSDAKGLVSDDQIAVSDLEWRAMSVAEVQFLEGDQVKLTFGTQENEKVMTSMEQLVVIRIWSPHPLRAWEPDSAYRSSLPVLRELVGLTMHVGAQIDSRLAGAGVFIAPSSAAEALKKSQKIPEDSDEDPFTEALIQAMTTPINDRSSAAAIVPLVLTVPDDSADKFKHIKFSTDLDSAAIAMREEAIRRLALGLDAPPELLLGQAGMNHWGAWLVSEEVVTTHITPYLDIISEALTLAYLRPVLRAMGMGKDESELYAIDYSVEHLISRPNKGPDSITLYKEGIVSAGTAREANGFDDGDAPASEKTLDETQVDSQTERRQAAGLKAIELAQANPELLVKPGLQALANQVYEVLEGAFSDVDEQEAQQDEVELEAADAGTVVEAAPDAEVTPAKEKPAEDKEAPATPERPRRAPVAPRLAGGSRQTWARQDLDPTDDGVCIVAIPAMGQEHTLVGVCDYSQELHMTLAYLGKVAECSLNLATLSGQIAEFITQSKALEVPVTFEATGFLGDDVPPAMVAFAVQETAQSLYDLMLMAIPGIQDSIKGKAAEAGGWLPHMTMGYGDKGAEAANYLNEETLETPVVFDRIEVWWGSERISVELFNAPLEAYESEHPFVESERTPDPVNLLEELVEPLLPAPVLETTPGA